MDSSRPGVRIDFLHTCVFFDTFTSSLVTYTKVFSTSYAVYVVGVAKSTASYTIHITALSSSTGQVLNDVNVPSNIADPVSDLTLLSLHVPHDYRPRIAWLEDGHVKSKALTPDLKNAVGKVKTVQFEKLLDVGLNDYGHFIGLKKGEPARVLKMEEDGTSIQLLGEFEKVQVQISFDFMTPSDCCAGVDGGNFGNGIQRKCG